MWQTTCWVKKTALHADRVIKKQKQVGNTVQWIKLDTNWKHQFIHDGNNRLGTGRYLSFSDFLYCCIFFSLTHTTQSDGECVCVFFLSDLNRTFPDNIQFRKSANPCLQKALYNVLLAYGQHNSAVGYCQVTLKIWNTKILKDWASWSWNLFLWPCVVLLCLFYGFEQCSIFFIYFHSVYITWLNYCYWLLDSRSLSAKWKWEYKVLCTLYICQGCIYLMWVSVVGFLSLCLWTHTKDVCVCVELF